MPPRRYWQELTRADFEAGDVGGWIAVLPVAAIEQHGPHLPVATDRVINEGCLEAALALLPPDLPVLVLPVQAVGKSNEHIHSPGTLTLGHETLIRLLVDLGESVARAGVRKLVLLNSHGGNVAVLDIVARELRLRCGMLCVAASWARFGQPEGLYDAFESTYGIHGGDMETSAMLALRPELVRMDRAARFGSLQEQLVRQGAQLRAHGPNGFGWLAQDLNPEGVVGDASVATAEKGRASIAFMAARFVELLQEMHAFSLETLWNPTVPSEEKH